MLTLIAYIKFFYVVLYYKFVNNFVVKYNKNFVNLFFDAKTTNIIMTKEAITRKNIDEYIDKYYKNKYDKLGKTIDASQWDLRGIDLRGINLKIFETSEEKLDLDQVTIDREQLDLLKVLRTSFKGVKIKNETIGVTNISDRKVGLTLEVALDLSDLDFSNAQFENTKINGLIWCDTKLDGINLTKKDISKTITNREDIKTVEPREVTSKLARMLKDYY